jgi:hypothetical protein
MAGASWDRAVLDPNVGAKLPQALALKTIEPSKAKQAPFERIIVSNLDERSNGAYLTS